MSSITEIKKVAVIGAGIMGAGIAAQAANAGAEVLLLDIVPADAKNRNQIAQAALEGLLKGGSSGGLMHPSVAKRILIGNIEDDFHLLASYDWIVEVVIERLDIKQDLYRRIAQIRHADAIVSSNTSTIPLHKLVEGLPESFREHFVVTHYFNPPRYMRLVEIIEGKNTLTDVVNRVSKFNDRQMGKTVINCTDRPGFIGNRLGVFWMQVALQEAIKLELTVEEADAIMKVCGFPKTGIFGLWDLVGIDLMPSVTESLGSLLADTDDFAPYADTVDTVQGMLDKGYYGRKGRVLQGFHRQFKDDKGKRIKEVIDLTSLEYRTPQKVTLKSAQLKPGQLAELINTDDKGGQYAWRVLSQMLHYATKLMPEVATEVGAFDQAMKLGYNWTWGSYQMIDLLGSELFSQRLQADGVILSEFMTSIRQRSVYRYQNNQLNALDSDGSYQAVKTADGILSLADIKQKSAVYEYSQSMVWDIGDNVWCMEFIAKVPTLSLTLLEQIETTLEHAITQDKALVFYNEGPIFIAGADLKGFLNIIDDPEKLEHFINKGQHLFQALKTAPIPIVGALSGKALGGGFELLLHCHSIQVHAEASIGLVENLVGIVPGWGGCKEMLVRCYERFGADQAITKCFNLIQSSHITASAFEAQQLGFLTKNDCISMNLDRLLFDAKQKAIALRTRPNIVDKKIALTVNKDIKLNSDGYQSTLDVALFELLSRSQKDDWYPGFFEYEKNVNLALCQIPESKARMQHFMGTGKPLRN